jgi:hypothetical protein
MPATKNKTQPKIWDLLDFTFTNTSRPNFDQVEYTLKARAGGYADGRGDDGTIRQLVQARQGKLRAPIDALLEQLKMLPEVQHAARIFKMAAEVLAKIAAVEAAIQEAQGEVTQATRNGDMAEAEQAQRGLHDRQAELARLRQWHDKDIAINKKRVAALATKAIATAVDDCLRPFRQELKDKTQDAKSQLVEVLTPSAIEFLALEAAERGANRERLIGRFSRELGLGL